MLVSAEVRWFWKASPLAIERWFRDGDIPAGGGRLRDDEYLVDPRQAELGIKKRGGADGIEIKGLVEVRGPLPVPWPGRAQIWTKWTSETMTIVSLPRTLVRKTRWLRRFDTGGPDVRELALDEHERLLDTPARLSEQGCHLEFVALTAGDEGESWWTFGVEAFGGLEAVERSLHRTLGHVKPPGPHAFAGGVELSYPAWLATHVHR